MTVRNGKELLNPVGTAENKNIYVIQASQSIQKRWPPRFENDFLAFESRLDGPTLPSVWHRNRKAVVGFAERSPSIRNDYDDNNFRVNLARDEFYDTGALIKNAFWPRSVAPIDGDIAVQYDTITGSFSTRTRRETIVSWGQNQRADGSVGTNRFGQWIDRVRSDLISLPRVTCGFLYRRAYLMFARTFRSIHI